MEPASKQDLAHLESLFKQDLTDQGNRFKKDLVDLENRLKQEMADQENRLVETIRDSETRLLSAFYSFAESNQKRLYAVETDGTHLRERISTLETRMLAVEKKLNMPPSA